MPASGKMLKSRQQAENRANGIGDEQGRLPSRVKAPEVMLKCTMCGQEIRATKTNTEAKSHWDSKHPQSTFAVCFVGAFDPTIPVASSATASVATANPVPELGGLKIAAPVAEKKKKPKEDLSFLDAALAPTKGKK